MKSKFGQTEDSPADSIKDFGDSASSRLERPSKFSVVYSARDRFRPTANRTHVPAPQNERSDRLCSSSDCVTFVASSGCWNFPGLESLEVNHKWSDFGKISDSYKIESRFETVN